MTPEEIAQIVFDQWYADAASFTGPTARRECITAIAAAIRAAQTAERQRCIDAITGLYHGDTCVAVLRNLN